MSLAVHCTSRLLHQHCTGTSYPLHQCCTSVALLHQHCHQLHQPSIAPATCCTSVAVSCTSHPLHQRCCQLHQPSIAPVLPCCTSVAISCTSHPLHQLPVAPAFPCCTSHPLHQLPIAPALPPVHCTSVAVCCTSCPPSILYYSGHLHQRCTSCLLSLTSHFTCHNPLAC